MARKKSTKKATKQEVKPQEKPTQEKQEAKGKAEEKQEAKGQETKKTLQVKIPPPPKPDIVIDGVANPMAESKKYKRAFCVALAKVFAEHGHPLADKNGNPVSEEINKVAEICRHTGVVKKLGFSEEKPDSENLAKSELSGRAYARGTAMQFWLDGYHDKFPDKVGQCMEFANVAVKTYAPEILEG